MGTTSKRLTRGAWPTLSMILAFVMVLVAGAPVAAAEPEKSYQGRFSDDDGNVHEPNIEVIAELGITLGCNPPDNDRYCPDRMVTRAQMMAFLDRLLGHPGTAAPTMSRFADVPDNAWYLPNVERMAELGVVEPYDDGSFRPSDPVTRTDIALFLVRAFPSITEVAQAAGIFTDVPADSEYAGAVEGILAAGVTLGCESEPPSYCPERTVPRDQMASFLIRALKHEKAGTEEVTYPGEGVKVRMARANWSTGYFQAALLRELLGELGYQVADPANLELGPTLAYVAMAQGEVDFWANGWFPSHERFLAGQLPDGSFVGEHVSPVGGLMVAGGLQGFLVTKSYAEEYGIRTLDDLDRNPAAVVVFDATDPDPGNGFADIYGCPESWTCDDIIDSIIAWSGWSRIRQVTAGYDAMNAGAERRVTRGEPMVAYVWTPSSYVRLLVPGENVVWLAVEGVLDDSNPLGRSRGEDWDQRPGTAPVDSTACPDAAERGICQLGWLANDIRVAAGNSFLEANPAARRLFEVVRLDLMDVSTQIRSQDLGHMPTDLAARWIEINRSQVDTWLAAAREAAQAVGPD